MSLFANMPQRRGTGGSGLDVVTELPTEPKDKQVVVDMSSGVPITKVYDEKSGNWLTQSSPAPVGNASEVAFNNTGTTLTSNNVQDGIKELDGKVDNHKNSIITITANDALQDLAISDIETQITDINDVIANIGTIGQPISADDIVETADRIFISPTERAEVLSHTSELASHSQRISNLELDIQNVSGTDEKVKLDVNDASGYLGEKIDNITIQNVGGKLVSKGIDGLQATLVELNQLQGANSNIQAQIDSLTSIGNFSTSVNTFADLSNISSPTANDMVIVVSDEMNDNATSIYIYNGTDWNFAGEFKGGEVRNFTTNPLDLSTETTGMLAKSKYEKPIASEITVNDVNGNLVANNVEDAIAELFQYANNGKKSIANVVGSPLNNSDTFSSMETKIQQIKLDLANAITDKGVITYAYNTLSEMANKIKSISNITLEGTTKSVSKLNITAPYTYQIQLTQQLKIEDVMTTVFQYVGADSNVVHYNANYNNGESDSFNYNPNEVQFDGFMNIKDTWNYSLNEIEPDAYYESEEINFAEFSDFGDDLELDTNNLKATIKGLINTSAVVVANGDISIAGVESLDKIDWINVLGGNGISKLAISFDSGLSWASWNGTEWIPVDINNNEDFKLNGMDKTVVDTLTDNELSIARGESNFIRFAYYLERPTFNDIAKNDKIELYVTMQGYNVLAQGVNINYDMATRTLTYDFTNSGTYSISYQDV